MLTLFAKLLKVLNSEASPWQVGWAIALGLMAGLLPFGFLTLIVLLVVCLFAVNISAFILMWGLSGGLMLYLGGSLEVLTWQYAQQPGLLKLLASVGFLQVLHLHHTLVLGAFVLGLFLLVPIAWASAKLVLMYRAKIMNKIQQWKLVQVIKASKLFQLYETLS